MSSTKRFINELTENEKLEETFLLAGKQLRQNRNGNLYLQLRLADRSGTLTGMMWNATERTGSDLEVGDYVRVQGATQIFNDALQMIVTRVERVPDHEVHEADYVRVAKQDTENQRNELRQWLQTVQQPFLRELSESFLMDDGLMDRFARAPAAIKHHHAYVGGLLEHTLSMVKLADMLARHYPRLHRDLLVMGAFLHDIGKIAELNYERELGYTDEGQLIGHLVLGVEILNRKIIEAEHLAGQEFPLDLVWQLKHMIVSHHGKLEFGSPKLPMTLEAVALHFMDDLDAKLHLLCEFMDEDMNTDSPWTTFHTILGRKFFKGPRVL